MEKRECPHMGECKQFVLEHDFAWKCLGKISWNQENCFKSNAIGITEMRRLPIEWWTIKLIDRYRDKKKGEIKMKEILRNRKWRPTVVSITSVIIFLSGFVWTVSATILGVAMMYIPLPSIFVIATLFGLVAGPLLTLAGYNFARYSASSQSDLLHRHSTHQRLTQAPLVNILLHGN